MERSPDEVIAFLDQHRESHIKHCNTKVVRFDLEREHAISQGQRQQMDSSLSVADANNLFHQFLHNDPAPETLKAAAKVLKEAPNTTYTNKSFAKAIEVFLSLKITSSGIQNTSTDAIKSPKSNDQTFMQAKESLNRVYLSHDISEENWIPDHSKVEYVNLSLVNPDCTIKTDADLERKSKEEAKPIQYDNILSYVGDGTGRKKILIDGEAGIGKSTLTKKMCSDSVQGTFGKDFELLIRVVLRGLPSDPKHKLTLEDLVESCTFDVNYSLEEDEITTLCDHIRSSKGKGVLFIYDGFDELSEKFQKSSLVKEIIHGKQFRESSFIITSRPIASYSLQSLINRRITINGLDDEKIKLFVRNYYKDTPSQADKMLELVKKYPSIKSLCHIPLTLLMICYVGRDVPDTETALHIHIICFAVQRHLKRKKGDDYDEEEDEVATLEDIMQHPDVGDRFRYLCELALKGIVENELIFSDEKLSEEDRLGLMSCIKAKGGLRKVTPSCYFVHKTFQEFMAAYAMLQGWITDGVDIDQIIQKKFTVQCDEFDRWYLATADPKYERVFLFYAGLGGLHNKDLQQNLLDALKGSNPVFSDYTPLLQLCRLLREARPKESCPQLIYPEDFHQQIVSCTGPEVTVDKYHYDNEAAESFLCHASSAPVRVQLQLSGKIPSTISAISYSKSITALQLEWITKDDTANLAKLFKQLTHLKSLNVSSHGNSSPAVVMPNLPGLDHLFNNLEELHLHIDRVTADVIPHLVKYKKQKSLELSGRHFPKTDLPLKPFLRLLETQVQLLKLELECFKLSECEDLDSIYELKKRFEQMKCLEHVSLHYCDEDLVKGTLGAEVALKRISAHIQEGRHLTELIVPHLRRGMMQVLYIFRGSLEEEDCAIFTSLGKLEELSYGFADFGEPKMAPEFPGIVEQALAGSTSLRKLSMYKVYPSVTAAVIRGIAKNNSLEEVQLAFCDFEGLSCHLKVNKLRKLTVANSYNISVGYIATLLSEGLRDNTTLQELFIESFTESSADDVTAEGMKAVQESIRNNTALVKLTIKCIEAKFSHLAVPILQGVLDNSVLRSVMLKMGDKTDQVDRFIDQVRSERPRTRLIINIKGL